jgi:hypothetical protein
MMQLHPITHVAGQYAERSLYELFGFERIYEVEEFPGFWLSGAAMRSSGFSERRLGNRPARRACGGSSSSTPLIKSRDHRNLPPGAVRPRSSFRAGILGLAFGGWPGDHGDVLRGGRGVGFWRPWSRRVRRFPGSCGLRQVCPGLELS